MTLSQAREGDEILAGLAVAAILDLQTVSLELGFFASGLSIDNLVVRVHTEAMEWQDHFIQKRILKLR